MEQLNALDRLISLTRKVDTLFAERDGLLGKHLKFSDHALEANVIFPQKHAVVISQTTSFIVS